MGGQGREREEMEREGRRGERKGKRLRPPMIY